MYLRRRTQARPSSHQQIDDDERLLPAIELSEYSTDAFRNASPRICKASESDALSPKKELHACPHRSLPRKPLRRIGKSLKLDSCLDALKCRLQQRSRTQWLPLDHSEELEFCHRASTSLDKRSRKGERTGRSCKATSVIGPDGSLRSSLSWYFCSPADTVKNCPTLEFLRTRLAPPNLWL